ncbi:MAG TPA: hypothetical protein VMP11_19810 [Verrucomicrobiae bacterium]|nr:hypothetical protein [Verrucomicrobiae bacterium]
MRSRFSAVPGLAIVACLLIGSSVRAQSTGTIYQITFNGSVVKKQDVSTNHWVVAKDTFTTARLTNLARGRTPDSAVPANEVLALVVFFDSDASNPTGAITVYDTTGQSNLAVVVNLQSMFGVVDSLKGKGYINLVGTIPAVGLLSGGWFAVTGSSTAANPTTAPRFTSFKGNAVQGEIAGNDGTKDFDILVTKGNLNLVRTLGTIIPPP